MGFAGGVVRGVWVVNDENTPNAGLSGGGIPARVWRDFMQQALGVGAAVAPEPVTNEMDTDLDNLIDPDAIALPIEGDIQGLGLNLHIGRDGSIEINRSNREDSDPRPRRDDRAPPRDPEDEEQ